MGKTLAEKIIGEHADKKVVAGETTIVKVDYSFTHDASGPLVAKQIKEMDITQLHNPKQSIIFTDHAVPSPRKEISNEHAKLRKFAEEFKLIFHGEGSGICHQIIAEKYASPGKIIVGTDSHSVMAGAVTSFATGMGATDIAVAMALGKTWLRVPETYKVQVSGKLPKNVYSKDVILHLIKLLGADGATYKSIEFIGDTIDSMSMSERLVLSNMVIEAGAKVGLISSDKETERYLKDQGRGDTFRELKPDNDALYEKEFDLDVSKLEPQVACPHAVDNVKPVSQMGNIKVDQVFVGSCTNARFEDLQIVASMLEGHKINSGTRLIVTPASKSVYVKSMELGIIKTLLNAGAVITPPGCGVCFGALGGVPADGEVILTTTNRNFKGRTGNPNAFTYLCSPATAVASAIKGSISNSMDVI